MDENKKLKIRREGEQVVIPTNTKEGEMKMEIGGVCDLSYPNSVTRRGRIQEKGNVAPTLTCGCENAIHRIEEPNVMSPKRTEYGKAIRKQYEQGNIKEQRKNIQQLEPRNDGMSNTLTGVQKDNYVAEPQQEAEFRIRKLTPRECFRLMGVGEPEIDTLTSCGISNSQLYKLAGNSIVVDVLEAIFDKMFVHTEVTEWTLF